MIGRAIDEFFVLGADAPRILGLFTMRKNADQVGLALDHGVDLCGGGARAHARALDLRNGAIQWQSATRLGRILLD